MSEIDGRKQIGAMRERLNALSERMPILEIREPLRVLGTDLESVLTAMLARIEKLENQLREADKSAK